MAVITARELERTYTNAIQLQGHDFGHSAKSKEISGLFTEATGWHVDMGKHHQKIKHAVTGVVLGVPTAGRPLAQAAVHQLRERVNAHLKVLKETFKWTLEEGERVDFVKLAQILNQEPSKAFKRKTA